MAITSTEVEQAIRAVMTAGQSYTLSDGRSVTRANLAELRSLLVQVQASEAAVARGGVFVPIGFGRPS